MTKKLDLKPYRRYGMTLLQMMGLVILLGIIATVILRYWYG